MMPRILFVDDEPEYVRPQIDALVEAGYDVVHSMNPDDALLQLKTAARRFDLIVLDLIMSPANDEGGLNNEQADYVEAGPRLHEIIREDIEYSNVPIIFLSVVRDQDLRHRLRRVEEEYGNELRFLSKPVSSFKVVQKVQEALPDPD